MKKLLLVLALCASLILTTFSVSADDDKAAITKVKAGNAITFIIKSDGTLWGAGYNFHGELGIGYSNICPSVFTQALDANKQALTDVIDVASGSAHSIALKKDGSVWGTGDNDAGPLGRGKDTTELLYFTQLTYKDGTPITNVKSVSAASGGSILLMNDGNIWVSGSNLYGELGLFNTYPVSEFTKVELDSTGSPLAKVKSVAAGSSHTLLLMEDGTVMVAGHGGLCGLGGNVSTPKFTTVKDENGQVISDIIAVSAGLNHSLLLKSDGSVWASGINDSGLLGLEKDKYNEAFFHQVETDAEGNKLDNVIAISAGYVSSLILKNDGSVWATGANGEGVIGIGSTDYYNPVFSFTQSVDESKKPLDHVVQISNGSFYAAVLKDDGTLRFSGNDSHGQFGFIRRLNSNVYTFTKFKPGDINNDTKIDAKDALAILTHVAKIELIEDDISLTMADTDFNSAINASDALLILKYAARIIYEF